MKIEIIKQDQGESNYWTVKCDDKYAEDLSYDEMLVVLISLTFSDNDGRRPGLQWMRTKEDHEKYNEQFSKTYKYQE